MSRMGQFQPHGFPRNWIYTLQRAVFVAKANLYHKAILFGEVSFRSVSGQSVVFGWL